VLVDAAHVDAATARIASAFVRRFRRQPTVRRVEAAAGAGLVRQTAAL